MKTHYIRNIRFVFDSVRKYDRKLKLIILFLVLLSVSQSFAGVFLPQIVTDGIVNHKPPIIFFMEVAGFTLFLGILHFGLEYFKQQRRFRDSIIAQGSCRDLFYYSLSCAYDYFEHPDNQRRYNRIKQNLDNNEENSYNVMLTATADFLVNCMLTVLFTALLANLNWMIILFVAVGSIIQYVTEYLGVKKENKMREERSTTERKLQYVLHTSENYQNGKDIRLYRMQQWIFALADRIFKQKKKQTIRQQKYLFMTKMISILAFCLQDGIAYTILIYNLTTGKITTGEFILYGGSIAGLSSYLSRIIQSMSMLRRANLIVEEAYQYMHIDNKKKRRNDSLPLDNPVKQQSNTDVHIAFSNVDFQYDANSSRKILSDISLTIHQGEKLAIVGENGAGKTTLISLLCGLYQPIKGQVHINGLDVRSYSHEQLRHMIGVVSQDFVILPFSVGANVTATTNFDQTQVCEVLKEAGLDAMVEKNPDLPRQTMTKIADPEGIVLSGGETQKLLMARALFKDAPILILDEPTAALDPIAESAVYENYKNITQGKTSVFISHRLASTRFCDTIVVLKDGKIVEKGNHDRLMQQNGEYAKMFRAQSHYY
jgi:ABC-type multidrug transport system fused ATPase/permease subunit